MNALNCTAMNDIPPESKNKPVELLEPANYGEYLLHNRSDMLRILRQLLDHGSQITLFFNEGSDLLLSILLAVKDDELIFDYGANNETNQRALEAAKLFCVTQLDNVRVQFILRSIKSIMHEGHPAFRAALPDSVLRLQRREYFRLTVPLAHRLTCQIPLQDGHRIEVGVIDISGGGIAMVVPPDKARFEPGMEFPNCCIELPEVGAVTTTIRVLSLFEITLRNGSRVKRGGCQFINLPGSMANLIQRYIVKVERERKARDSGLR